MTRTFFTGTGRALTLIAPPASAQDAGGRARDTEEPENTLIRSSEITGGPLYSMNAADDEDWSTDTGDGAIGPAWTEIGTVEDVVLSTDGRMVGIVGEVGGIAGDRQILIPAEEISLVAIDSETYACVTRLSEEDLGAL